MFFWLSVGLNVLLIAWISKASYRHFDRGEKEQLGMQAIRILTPLGVLWNLCFLFFDGYRTVFLVTVVFFTVTILSTAIFALAIRETKGISISIAFSFDQKTPYVDKGIYKHIRHPFYASYIVYWMSWMVLNYKSWISLTIGAILIFLYVIAIKHEEVFLKSTYGERYNKHVSTSSKIIPFLY